MTRRTRPPGAWPPPPVPSGSSARPHLSPRAPGRAVSPERERPSCASSSSTRGTSLLRLRLSAEGRLAWPGRCAPRWRSPAGRAPSCSYPGTPRPVERAASSPRGEACEARGVEDSAQSARSADCTRGRAVASPAANRTANHFCFPRALFFSSGAWRS